MKKPFTIGMLFKQLPTLFQKHALALKSPVRLFAFSGIFWIIAAFFSQPHFWFSRTFSFTNPGVLVTPPSLWLKADADVTIVDGNVSYWRDQSGNANHAYQVESSKRPEWQPDYFNFNPVLTFNGADEFVYGVNGFSTQTFFIVAINDNTFSKSTSGQALLNFGVNGNNYLGLGSMTSYLDDEFISFGIIQDTVYRSGLTGNGYITAGPHMFASWRNQTADGPAQIIQVNGQTTVNAEHNPGADFWIDDEEYTLGGKRNSNGSVRNFFNGKIAEVIAFDAPLGKFDRAKVQSYLALKYGLTLDQNQEDPDLRAYYDANANVIWDPFRSLDFNRDIAGIGQDEHSTLNQPKSKSSNDNTFVTIGSPTDLSNGEFLIWANDGGVLEFTSDGAPVGYRRMGRRWQVQETGDVGDVTMSGLGTHLVIDREGDGFADNLPLPINAVLNLHDGDVFTFLVVDIELCGAPGGVNEGLATWLRADAGVSTTAQGGVNYWEDYSGQNHYLTQSNPSHQPSWSESSINFNPAVHFDEVQEQFLQSYAGGFSTHDYFLVFVPNDEIYASGGGGTMVGASQGSERFDFGYNAFTSALDNELLFHSIGLGYTYTAGFTDNRRIINSFYPYITNAKDKPSGNSTEIFFNGLPIANAQSGNWTAMDNVSFSLGASITGSRPHDGKIAEMIVYDTRNSDDRRRRIQSYLALKYGITLDQTTSDFSDRHYYNAAGDIIWNARINQGFAQDIAGIGLDAGSCLTQRQSQSQNPGGILRIGQASNHQNGEFLVWGSNGLPITQSGGTEAPSGFFALNRIWRAQETGEVGGVEIAFAKGALGRSNGAGYFLLVDTNNDASFVDETPQPFQFDGKNFIIKNVDLNDGNRFTIVVNCSGQTMGKAPVREEYYLPIPEEQLLEVLQTLYPSAAACNRSITAREPRAPVFNYTSITTQGQGTVIVYDHWEDGFEDDLENPQQSTTEIWGDANPMNGYPPGFPCDIILADAIVLDEAIDPDNRGDRFYYDGGDRLGSSGPIAITKANWSEGGRTLFAGAVEVFATDFWSNQYLIPFGQNVITSTQSLEYVGALIMARENHTEVNIDRNGDGTNDASVVLNQGQSYLVNGGLRTGAMVTASGPIQVHLATGDICDNFESRWFALPGIDITCGSYYSAVADNSVMYYFYNPNNTPITIEHRTASATQASFLVPAKAYSTQFYSTPDRDGHHFYTENGDKFYASFFYSINDYTTRGSAYDWGAMLICEDLLPQSLQIGWAYGQDPLLPQFENGSPIWLTAAFPHGHSLNQPISVCVDFNGDNLGPFSDGNNRNYDLLLSLDEYEAVRLFDPDGDQTGTIISVCDGTDAILSVHWGSDKNAASASEPGLDLGTGIPFTMPYYVDKQVAGLDGDDIYLAGDVIVYTIDISALGQNAIRGLFSVQDELPDGLEYIPGTTEATLSDSRTFPIPDDTNGQTLFPLDEAGLPIRSSEFIDRSKKLSIRFFARIQDDAEGEIVNQVNVVFRNYNREDEVAIDVIAPKKNFDLALTKELSSTTPGPFVPGDWVNFSIRLFNEGDLDAQNIQLNDYIPSGLILDDPNWLEASPGIATLKTPISSLAVGSQTAVVIRFRVKEGFQGIDITNSAEIAGASNSQGLLDNDSTPDNNPNNDTNEDDFDTAQINIIQSFDLSLEKTLSSTTPGPFTPGNPVIFELTITNEGSLTATNIQLNDYIPAGLTLADSDWNETIPGIATLKTPIASLAAGATTSVDILFVIKSDFQGLSLTNAAEIAGASNSQGLLDKDSTPDNNPNNDTNEDDFDTAQINIGQSFDLSLNKTLSSATSGPFAAGNPVIFQLTITNEGSLTATNIQLNDYIPAGLTLADSDWNETIPVIATLKTPIASLAAGATTSVDILFVIKSDFQGLSLTNAAEIASAGNSQGLLDKDSTPDNNPDNDINEDDFDTAQINIGQSFDLSLNKTLSSATSGPFAAGDFITFRLELTNEGTIDAQSIQLNDYIPTGLILADSDWSETIPGIAKMKTLIANLAAGSQMHVDIQFRISGDFQGSGITNHAEIAAASNGFNLADKDSTPDDNPGNDIDEDDADALSINLCTTANVGGDGVVEICTGCGSGSVYVDLFGALSGSPDAGGQWEDLFRAGISLQNPEEVDFAGLAPGVYRFRYSFENGGSCASGSSEVRVEVGSYAAVACNNRINVTFDDDNCYIQVNPDLILEGNSRCSAEYEVRLYDEQGLFLGDVITGEQAGQIITAEVHNLTCGTYCSGELRIEDITSPQITCPETQIDLVCSDADSVFQSRASLALLGEPTVLDNCANPYELNFTDQVTENGDCGLVSIVRRFTATDPSGNESSCQQIIHVRKPDFSDMTLPASTIQLSCDGDFRLDDDGNPHPSETGFPEVHTIYGTFPLDQVYCNLGASYSDSQPIVQCAGTFAIVRSWTLVDWCATATQSMNYTQIINIQDSTPPVVVCSNGETDTLRFSTGPFDCTAIFFVPMPQVTDNCSDWTLKVEAVTDVEVLVYNQYGQVIGSVTETRVLATLPPGSNTRYFTGIPTGCHRFRYTVVDACGNTTVEECPFCVSDGIEPIAVCDNSVTVSIGGAGVGRLYASDLDEGSWDNCGLAGIGIRRQVIRNENCIAVAETYTEWADFINLNCCDLGLPLKVDLLVIDKSGNQNTCRSTLTLRDQIRPDCIAPPNQALGCNELPDGFNPRDLAALQVLFGEASAEDNCGTATWQELSPQISLADCGDGTITRLFQAQDAQGNVSSICRQVVTIEQYNEYEIQFPADVMSDCGEAVAPGLVLNTIGCDDLGVSVFDETYTDIPGICSRTLRRYRVINWCSYDGQSDQLIISRDEDCDGQGGDEAVWVIHRDGTTYIDRDNDEQNNQPTAGEQLECTPGNPAGYWRTVSSVGFWQYTQQIDVLDSAQPEVVYTEPVAFCSTAEDCLASVMLPFSIAADCEELGIELYFDENEDGVIDRQLNTAAVLQGDFPNYTISVNLPIGVHAIEVHLADGCGMMTVAKLPFSVVDCFAPTPDCLQAMAFNLIPLEEGVDADGDGDFDMGAFEIEAAGLVLGSVSDCSGPVQFSIHRDGEIPNPEQTSIIITCDDADTVMVRVYAWDQALNPFIEQPDGRIGGPNYGYCETFLLVKDEIFKACEIILPGEISGLIMTEVGNAVENVTVNISGPLNQDNATGLNGAYLFESLEELYDYTVAPNLNLNHRNGVTTFDLTIIEKHILGTKKLDSPYKLIAADANRSGGVTVFDVIKIRRLILGEVDEFEENTSWRFVRGDHVFVDPENPFVPFIPEVITLNNLVGQVTNGDFVGVKIGDVNHTAIANSSMSAAPRALTDTMYFSMTDQQLKTGREYRIPVYLPGLKEVEGYQYTLDFNADQARLLAIEPGLAQSIHFGQRYAAEGMLTTSWNRSPATPEDSLAPMFTLVLKAGADAWLSDLLRVSSRITEAEGYNRVGESLAIGLAFQPPTATFAFPRLDQNHPNPFAEQTVIGYKLPVATSIRFSVFDVQGRQVYAEEGWRAAGDHQVKLDRRQLVQGGVYYYTLTTDGGFRETRKMVLF